MDDVDTRIAAHHEAGHQVMAFELGIGVRGVELTDDGGRSYDGLRFRSYDPTSATDGDNNRFRKKVLVLLAGGLAEERLFESEGICTDTDVHLATKDEVELREHYGVFEGADPPTALNLDVLRIEGEEIIRKKWGRVRRLAEQLLRCHTMSGQDVEACLLADGIVWDDDWPE